MKLPFWGSGLRRLKDLPRRKPGSFSFAGFCVDYLDAPSFYYEYLDIFEKNIYRFEADKPDPLILDAGGCIGMSVLYFKTLYPKAKVIAFEPDPRVFEVLERNVAQNRLEGVTLINAGLGKGPGTIPFFPDGADGGSMRLAQGRPIEVEIVSLSDYLQQPVDFLKMNIEGMEGQVLEEIEGCLGKIAALTFEYHAFHDLPQDLGKILQILDRQGFRYAVTEATSEKAPIPCTLTEGYRHFNIVYARRPGRQR